MSSKPKDIEFRKRKRDEVPEDFLCNVRHANNLPDVPFDPKLLAYPFESDRFTRYKGTSLESATNLGIRTEPDLGIHVDLLDPYAYVPPNASGAPVNPVDQELIDTPAVEHGESAESKEQTFQRIRQTVDWLRRPVYLDDYTVQFKSSTEMVAGVSLRKTKFDERSLAEQVEETFREVEVPASKLRHPTKAHLTAVEVLPIVPSFQLWGNEYSHVVFEEAQAIDEKGNQIKIKSIKEEKAKSHDKDTQEFAIIKGGYQDSVHTCVTHYVPAAEKPRETLGAVGVGDEHHFHWDTEYDFHLKALYDPERRRHVDWCLIEDPETGAVSYNMLVQHFRLSKRKALERKREEERRRFLPTGGMNLTYRDTSGEEEEKLQQRKSLLEPQVYDEDEEGPALPPGAGEDGDGAAGLDRLPSEEGEATPAAPMEE